MYWDEVDSAVAAAGNELLHPIYANTRTDAVCDGWAAEAYCAGERLHPLLVGAHGILDTDTAITALGAARVGLVEGERSIRTVLGLRVGNIRRPDSCEGRVGVPEHGYEDECIVVAVGRPLAGWVVRVREPVVGP